MWISPSLSTAASPPVEVERPAADQKPEEPPAPEKPELKDELVDEDCVASCAWTLLECQVLNAQKGTKSW